MRKILDVDGVCVLYDKNTLNKGTYCLFGIQTGAFSEKIWGTAHFLEHMLFYKTKNRTKDEIYNETNKLDVNAFTSYDSMMISFRSSSTLAEHCFDVCSDMYFNNDFDETDMDKERGPIIQEVIKAVDNKHRVASLNHNSKIFESPRMTQSAAGNVEDVKKLKKADLKEFQEKNYFKENFIVSVSSDLDADQIAKLVKKYIASNLKSKKDFVPVLSEDQKSKKKSFVNVLKNEKNDCMIALSFNTVKNNYKNYIYRRCLNPIVFYNAGKLNKVLREEHGLTYSPPGARNNLQKDEIVCGLELKCSHENIKPALKDIFDVFADYYKNGISKQDFENFREQNQLEFDISVEHPADIIQDMLFYVKKFGSLKTSKEIFNATMKIGLDELNKFAQRIFDIKCLQLTVSGNVKDEEVPTMSELVDMFNQSFGVQK